MECDTAIDKVMFELTERKVINTESSNILRIYFEQVYSIGMNYGISYGHNGKTVIALSPNGIKIGEYESLTIANKKTGISLKSISKAVTGKNITAGGYFWKYKIIK